MSTRRLTCVLTVFSIGAYVVVVVIVVSNYVKKENMLFDASHWRPYRLLDSLVVECWLRVREVPGSIPSQGPRDTKDVIKIVPVVPLFGTHH